MIRKSFVLSLLLFTHSAIADGGIEGVWSNTGGSFSFFSNGECQISWTTLGKQIKCVWKLEDNRLEINSEDGDLMQFETILDGEQLVLLDEQGHYQFKRIDKHGGQ